MEQHEQFGATPLLDTFALCKVQYAELMRVVIELWMEGSSWHRPRRKSADLFELKFHRWKPEYPPANRPQFIQKFYSASAIALFCRKPNRVLFSFVLLYIRAQEQVAFDSPRD